MGKFIIETSARHVHLTRADVDTLFGAGHQLTKKKDLSQPGQFACEEKVEVIGEKGSLKASILGPERVASQVELSLTDARAIGVKAPIRESGDIKGSGACKLVGPCGEVVLTEGAKGMSGAIEKAEELAGSIPKSFIAGQFVNPDNAKAHYETTGPEIWNDTDGNIEYWYCDACGKYYSDEEASNEISYEDTVIPAISTPIPKMA